MRRGGRGGWVRDIEEGTFWDEHWVLYGNQFDNKFHIKKNILFPNQLNWILYPSYVNTCYHYYYGSKYLIYTGFWAPTHGTLASDNSLKTKA